MRKLGVEVADGAWDEGVGVRVRMWEMRFQYPPLELFMDG